MNEDTGDAGSMSWTIFTLVSVEICVIMGCLNCARVAYIVYLDVWSRWIMMKEKYISPLRRSTFIIKMLILSFSKTMLML